MTRRFIDAEARDYVIEDGAFRRDGSRASDVLRLLTLRRGTAGAAPERGNRVFDELDKLVASDTRRAENFAREALAPLTNRRVITKLSVTATIADQGRLSYAVSWEDIAGSQAIEVDIPRGA